MMTPTYSDQDHLTWKTLYELQSPLRSTQLIPEFSQGLEKLGITSERIPDLDQVNKRLLALTGWRGVYVSGFVEARDFFEMLTRREFPVGCFIRNSKDLSYTPEPDVFHDLYGHLPFYSIPDYARFCEEFGRRALKHSQNQKALDAFQRLFWFTLEFALIRTPQGRRIFGAGIASSFSECAFSLSDKPRVHPFDLEKIRNHHFRIDLIQEDLYLLENAEQLYRCLDEFEKPYLEGGSCMSKEKLDKLFESMWIDYCRLNPQAQAVYDSLTKYGEKVVNDHIAFRTFSHPKMGIERLAQHFLKLGYREIGSYEFKAKKLNAKHFEHQDPTRPKVFISELDLKKVSSFVQQAVEEIGTQLQAGLFEKESVLWSGRPWAASFSTYQKLAEESEYAAWVYAHGFRPNHFTVFINDLKKLNRIEDLNRFLKEHGFRLNSSGGEIKGSPNEYLEQSSTMANQIPVSFFEGTFSIPACYYEFAKRYPLKNGELFQGFVADSADKIFESTNKLAP